MRPRAVPGSFDWVVEEGFAEIPKWHPAVDTVIPVAIRRWRKNLWQAYKSGEFKQLRQRLRANRYDLVIDAQGLLKSAWLTRLVKAPVAGLDKGSAREGLAARFYHRRLAVARGQHAVERVRQLFALGLGYDLPEGTGDYGLNRLQWRDLIPGPAFVVFLHGTTWDTKHWPEIYWRELAERLGHAHIQVRLPWGNEAEQARAQRIAAGLKNCVVLPRLNLAGMAQTLAEARACVAVDTGLGHLAAALDVPTISLFGPTNVGLTGAYGRQPGPPGQRLPVVRTLHAEKMYLPADAGRPASVRSQTRVAAVFHPAQSRARGKPIERRVTGRGSSLMQLAFVLYKYFPFGGLQRDFMRIALECQRRGHSIRVYTLIWEGEVPEGFEVQVAPVKAFFNHRRNEKLLSWMQADLAKRPVDRLIGFNKMPGLDVYYAADGCYEDKAQNLRHSLYRYWGRYKHFADYERAVFGRDAKTEILMISEVQQPLFIKHYDTPLARFHLLPPGIAQDRRAPPDAALVRAESAVNSCSKTTSCCWCRSARGSRPRAWIAASRPWRPCRRRCASACG